MGRHVNKVLIALCLLLAVPALAMQVKQITWDDLVPTNVVFDDPFEKLDREKLEYLGFVARVRNMIASDQQVSQGTMDEAVELEVELEKAGINVDELLARRDEIRRLREKRGTSVVENLDGETIRMPGYVLPL